MRGISLIRISPPPRIKPVGYVLLHVSIGEHFIGKNASTFEPYLTFSKVKAPWTEKGFLEAPASLRCFTLVHTIESGKVVFDIAVQSLSVSFVFVIPHADGASGISVEEATDRAVVGVGCNEVDGTACVDAAHARRLDFPIRFAALDDAEAVDPDILEA
jgi:hypothetical protein